MAIGFVVSFNAWPLDLVGTALIIVLIVFIRRLPYGVRSTSATLRTIKPSVEEAAISLGVPPSRVFLKLRFPNAAGFDCWRDDEFYHCHQ